MLVAKFSQLYNLIASWLLILFGSASFDIQLRLQTTSSLWLVLALLLLVSALLLVSVLRNLSWC